MNSHDVTLLVYVLIGIGGLVVEMVARRSSLPTFTKVLRRVMRTRAGRVAVLTGWAWLGLHFFAR